jgi:hypothetical protein
MNIHALSGKICLSLLACLCCIPVNPLYASDARSVKAAELIPTYSLLLSDPVAHQHIFLIGASTLRYDNNLPGDVNANTGLSQYPTRIGWGSALYRYLRYPANVSNQGRRGATSASYREEPPPPDDPAYKGPAWWNATRAMIEAADTSRGGFLLIQFGANDLFANMTEEDFKGNLRFYRDEAFALGLTPVFITPVDSRAQGDNRGNYPRYMIEMAAEPLPAPYQDRKVFLLDLHQRSLDRFGTSTTVNLDYRFGNVPYFSIYSGSFQRVDHTHFEERGAIRVAGWIRDLACELADQTLCRLFHQDPLPLPPTLYFTGEYMDDPSDADPALNGWYIADGDGNIISTDMDRSDIIEKVVDNHTGSTVLAFNTYFDATDRLLVHGFHTNGDQRSWANQDQRVIAWDSLFTSSDFRIYVEVQTSGGVRHFTYKPLDSDEGPGETMPQYIRFGLGSDATDGSWKSFTRNLAADLHRFEPDLDIIQVNGIRIRGTGRIDNLRMF